ncbi:uncharacterized protein EV422DRAFT_106370 [Fimicolochytrium jonesii]|uniref:uncharacterized protein n=1 Tax=Fimicolochytrium jonesii TaxID=1396493 RepID=UPI0022FE2C97|nr:uncharacterized protein EV422DRAFT_106370 [Fimicolochytrium jonesii]KAI8819759.1 hypothetical protein EV422DRAFT_106370 [Fimicolochytrium jonesii]
MPAVYCLIYGDDGSRAFSVNVPSGVSFTVAQLRQLIFSQLPSRFSERFGVADIALYRVDEDNALSTADERLRQRSPLPSIDATFLVTGLYDPLAEVWDFLSEEKCKGRARIDILVQLPTDADEHELDAQEVRPTALPPAYAVVERVSQHQNQLPVAASGKFSSRAAHAPGTSAASHPKFFHTQPASQSSATQNTDRPVPMKDQRPNPTRPVAARPINGPTATCHSTPAQASRAGSPAVPLFSISTANEAEKRFSTDADGHTRTPSCLPPAGSTKRRYVILVAVLAVLAVVAGTAVGVVVSRKAPSGSESGGFKSITSKVAGPTPVPTPVTVGIQPPYNVTANATRSAR